MLINVGKLMTLINRLNKALTRGKRGGVIVEHYTLIPSVPLLVFDFNIISIRSMENIFKELIKRKLFIVVITNIETKIINNKGRIQFSLYDIIEERFYSVQELEIFVKKYQVQDLVNWNYQINEIVKERFERIKKFRPKENLLDLIISAKE